MIKFSRAGWNNVIIFSAMLFILLINISNKKLFHGGDTSAKPSIFQQNDVIVALNIKQKLQITRLGRNWQISSPLLNEQALKQMMQSWQQLDCEPIDFNISQVEQNKNVIPVTVDLANEQQLQLLLLATQEELLVLKNHHTVFACPSPLYRQLLPFEIY